MNILCYTFPKGKVYAEYSLSSPRLVLVGMLKLAGVVTSNIDQNKQHKMNFTTTSKFRMHLTDGDD